ncbi:MAG TPA: SRPBCC domain-containing protein [Candidatus Acidoferrum sp.]
MNDSSDLPVPAQPPTRRQMLVGTTAVLTGLGFGPFGALAHTEEEVSRTAESIHQELVFKANPKRVYEALTDEKQFEKVTQLSAAVQSGPALGNKPTQIAPEAGGPFTIFRGHIVGRHIELVPNQRIVQAWRVVDWDPGIYSIVKFELTEQGSGTKIILDHAGFPPGHGQHLADGWRANYWEPLEKYLI